ncbi:MAG: 3-phosphoglycerate dehydrogenase [Flavobacteriales bacterium]|nr:3-phosphoglycerate dehydrogenase [Flavobacteriales bacterium]
MSKKILANDGIDETGKTILEKAGFTVVTEKVDQDKLIDEINNQSFVGITVRSATKVRKDIIDSCSGLKVIARGGVGMDNIDVEYAKDKGLQVINTPAASSNSVAELVFAHLFNAVRFLYDSNRQMPVNGLEKFAALKKQYAGGLELRDKTIGIIGFGRIGQNVAKIALGLGMKVLAYDPFVKQAMIQLPINGIKEPLTVTIDSVELQDLLKQSDFITVHVPGGSIIGKPELEIVKKGVILINTARGGVIDEAALVDALDKGTVSHACLDVFVNEPTPSEAILKHPKISLTPHIGAATNEAQERIGVELAEKIILALS